MILYRQSITTRRGHYGDDSATREAEATALVRSNECRGLRAEEVLREIKFCAAAAMATFNCCNAACPAGITPASCICLDCIGCV